MRAEVFDGIESLPETYLRLLETAGDRNVLRGLDWYENLLRYTAEPEDRVRLYGVASGGTPDAALALFVARVRSPKYSVMNSAKLEEFANFYSLEGGPVVDQSIEDSPDLEAVLDCLIGAICAETPRWDMIQFGPLNRPSQMFDAMASRLRSRRLAVEPFFQHKNWYEDIEDCTFEQYIGRLGKSAKEAVRKNRKLDRERKTEWTVTTGSEDIERALASYQHVYLGSWKEPELYPHFIPEFIRSCARKNCLRLGNLYVDGEPAATQLVIMSRKKAVMFKTAYVPEAGSLSAGTAVMVRMMQHIISKDNAERIDFGAGDEPYKAQWAKQCRERWGLMAYNLATARGTLINLAVQAQSLTRRFRKTGLAYLTKKPG